MFQPEATVERDDFCSLAPIGWLHHKLQDTFFLVVGTHSCQGFLQTALGVMVFAKPRFATAVLDEDDLGGRDVFEALLPVVRDVVEAERPAAIVLGATCTPNILGMPLDKCAPALEAELGVRVYPAKTDGFDPAYTQGEDHILASMIARSPETDEQNLVILGCLSALEEAEIRLECRAMGLPAPRFLPAESGLDLAPIGPKTVLAPVHPYLFAATAIATRLRGTKAHRTLFPIGPDGTRAFYEGLAAAFGKTVSYADREREAWAALDAQTQQLAGTTIAIASDALLELPLARTLRRAGAHVPLVSTPNVYRKFHALEVEAQGGIEVLERIDRRELLAKIDALRPDLVVANLNIANALEGAGHAVKWSTELTFQPVHGFGGAPALFAMFTAALRRHAALAKSGERPPPIDLSAFRSSPVLPAAVPPGAPQGSASA